MKNLHFGKSDLIFHLIFLSAIIGFGLAMSTWKAINKERKNKKHLKDVAPAFAEMSNKIYNASTWLELCEISTMRVSFKKDFEGIISEAEIKSYCDDISEMITLKRQDIKLSEPKQRDGRIYSTFS